MQFDDQKLKAYRGDRPFAFLSYSHKDMADAELITRELIDRGFRVWFDEGLTPAKEWDEVIASRVEKCGYFIALISQNYLESENCRDELNYARDKNRPRMLIYLEDVELPGGMAMRLLRNHALHRWEFDDIPSLIDKAVTAEGFEVCRDWRFVPEWESEPSRSSTPAPKPKAKPKKAWWIVVAAVVLIAAIAAALALIYGKQACDPDHPLDATTQSPAAQNDTTEQNDATEIPTAEPAQDNGRMAELEVEWETADFYFSVGGVPHAVFYNRDGLTDRILMRRLLDGRFTICTEYRFTWTEEQINTIERYDTAGNLITRHTFSYDEDWLVSDTIVTDGIVSVDEMSFVSNDPGGTVVAFPEEGIVFVGVEDPALHDTYYEESMKLYNDGFVLFIGGYSHQTVTVIFQKDGKLAEEAYMVGDPADAKYYDKQWRAID